MTCNISHRWTFRPLASGVCHVVVLASDRMDRLFPGDVSERPKEHAWKACVVQATAGSNPAVTAKSERASASAGALSLLSSTGDSGRSERREHRSPAVTAESERASASAGALSLLSSTGDSGRSERREHRSPAVTAESERASASAGALSLRPRDRSAFSRRSARRRSVRRARPGDASSRAVRRRRRLRCCSDRCPGVARALRVGSARRTAFR